MALTTCFECEKEVSSTAKTCPHCGVFEPWHRKREVTAKGGSFTAMLQQAKLNLEEDGRNQREKKNSSPGGAGCGGVFVAVVLALIFFFVVLPILFWGGGLLALT